MSTAELRLSYKPEDEWHGLLEAVVSSGEFSGKGAAWFSKEQLKDVFVVALHAYPLSASDPPTIEGGFWSKDNPATLDQCHLRIAVRPYNSRGTLIVQVDLTTPCWTTSDNDQQQSITARFLTDYAALEEFASNLEHVFDGESDSAVLPGTAN